MPQSKERSSDSEITKKIFSGRFLFFLVCFFTCSNGVLLTLLEKRRGYVALLLWNNTVLHQHLH